MSAPGAEWISDRSRENTPEEPGNHHGSPQQRTSRKRKVLSCYACRSRKMKCDRVFPVCGRCEKTGRSQECTYDPRLVQETRTNTGAQTEHDTSSTSAARPVDGESLADTSDVLRWKIQLQERRIAMLEQRLAVQVGTQKSSQYSDVVADEPEFKEEVMFRSKGFRSQFHGPTSYHELHAFTFEALTVDQSVLRIKTDFKQFRDRRKKLSNERNAKCQDADAEVLAALPEQCIVEARAVVYFGMWEKSYRILHEPTFWREYSDFLEDNHNSKPQVSFAVILVLIIAATKCLEPKDDMFIGDTTADRHAANHLLSICENWMNQQPRKRVTLQFFQIQCLALLTKRANSVKMKQDWVASGELLRLSLASGMHRDAASLGHEATSAFDEEMKRRLWATIMELELQSSVESGLHTGLSALSYDTAPPANLSDDAFSSDTQQLPTSQPSEHFTSASYLVMAVRSLPLRIQLTQLLNNPSGGLQYADVLQFDGQIRSAILVLPTWEDEAAVLPSGLLRLQLRQYLLMLHKPYARLAHKHDRYMYSFTTCIDTCSSIIAIHDDLLLRGILALSNMRNDVIRVGLTLSQIVYHNCARNIAKSSAPLMDTQDTQDKGAQRHIADMTIAKRWKIPSKPLDLVTFPEEPFVVRLLCTSSIEIIERARQLFEQKVFRMGTGYVEYGLMSAAVSMLPSQPSPATSIAYINNAKDDIPSRCRKTLEGFTNLALRVLALQQDPENSLASSLRDTIASVSSAGSKGTDVDTGGFNGGDEAREEPHTGGNCGFMPMAGVGMGLGAGNGSGDLNGYTDSLQDMPVDMNGWAFPDFWAFDLGGDF
ncbi:C6 zinc finger domain containing protein [Pyrenophora tritici-repentis]|uniref:C6 zinc finger domain containing protein n=1 Tax=Pyrenophora tritici-repentis TaxID=45151 RepID=A0A2W1E912_9PLEO|nr:C6 zinc finger domain containing protein [Pyrenophora tritici-repentis]KAI1527907.1 C6 zinc finger domain containing protein [Pyrenophora tritici-repentis]KAI1538744.1 C6 zinc finger domain containing protein [Pyrenophora tritici-repentis]KAI1569458.1 C6 zinc finger domain containing protein [Pyrenophora tritici-repentis]KAI1577489.1 C6 zinc finger domain containing protein [Pyrenophora tritici-repentis]